MLGQTGTQPQPMSLPSLLQQVPNKRSPTQWKCYGSLRLAQYANHLRANRNRGSALPNIVTILAAAGFSPENPAQLDSTVMVICSFCGARTQISSNWNSISAALNFANDRTNQHLTSCLFIAAADLGPFNNVAG